MRQRLKALAAGRQERVLARQLHVVASELAAHLRAGRSLSQAVADVVPELPSPAREALGQVDAAIRLGTPPPDALAAMGGGDDGALLAAAVSVQARAGGDLSALLDDLSFALQERESQRRAVEVATAQARATARMVAGMPAFGLGALWLFDRGTLLALVSSPLGWGAIVLSGCLSATGLLLISRLAAVDR
jgi:tight adherence protein B